MPRHLRKLTSLFRRTTELRQQPSARAKHARRLMMGELLEDRRMLAAVSWDGGGGNLLWSNPQNWSNDQLPGENDDVTISQASSGASVDFDFSLQSVAIKSLESAKPLIISAGTLSVAEPSSATNLTLSGGNLAGSGDVTVTQELVWSAGVMDGSGRTIVSAAAHLEITGVSNKFLGRTLDNAGTAIHDGGLLYFNQDSTGTHGGVINNLATGTFKSVGEREIRWWNWHNDHAFNNAGIFEKEGLGTTSRFNGVRFFNTGTVNVNLGFLELSGGESDGEFVVSENSGLHISSTDEQVYVFNRSNHNSPSIRGEGSLVLFNNTFATPGAGYTQFKPDALIEIKQLTVWRAWLWNDASLSLSMLTLRNGGTLTGAGDVIVTQQLEWLGGTMSGSGKTIVAPGATMTLSGSNDKVMARTIDNHGTTIYDGSHFYVAFGIAWGVFNNLEGGLFDVAGDGDIYSLNHNSNSTYTFNNAGTFSKAGSGETYLNDVPLNNTGTINIYQGTLNLPQNLSINGVNSLSIGTDAKLEIGGDLVGASVAASKFNLQGNIHFWGNGTRTLEVMSRNLGNTPDGFTRNFAHGTIELAQNTQLKLVDNANNAVGANEALYVDTLIVPSGSTLDLNGLDAYVRTIQVDGDVINGELILLADTVTPLTLGETFQGSIKSRAWQYFKVDYAADSPVFFRLEGLPTDGTVELFIGRGSLPSRTTFDAASRVPFANYQFAYLPEQSEAGTYFLLVHAPTLTTSPATFILTAWGSGLAVLDKSFGTAGNVGDFTLQAHGGKFDAGTTARIANGQGFNREATRYYRSGYAELAATFDLLNVPPGTYDVVFANASGEVVQVPDSLTIVSSSVSTADAVIPRVIVPSAIRRGVPYSFTVEWENTSLNDAYAPLLTVGNSAPFGLSPDDRESLGTRYTFLGTNTQGGRPGILRPGQRESITFYSYSGTESGDYTAFVDREFKDLSAPFDWSTAISAILPADMPVESAAAVMDLLQFEYAENTVGYLRLLATSADASWTDTRNPKGLLQQEIYRAWSRLEFGVWGIIRSNEIQPEGGWKVIATESTSGLPYTTRTDRLGGFSLPNLPNGSFELFVEGYTINNPSGGIVVELVAGQSVGPLELSVSLTPAVNIQIDMLDGEPVGNAVAILSLNDSTVAIATTNNIGMATFSGVDPGTYTLILSLAEGGLRQYQGVVIPTDVTEVIEINLASAVIRGTLPASQQLYPLLVTTEVAINEVVHAEQIDDEFVLSASAGEYRLLLFDNNADLIEEIGIYHLMNGNDIDVGLIGGGSGSFSGFRTPPGSGDGSNTTMGSGSVNWFTEDAYVKSPHVANLPVSLLAKIDLTLLAFRDPDIAEAILGPVVLFGTDIFRGSEYTNVVEQYMSGGDDVTFTEGPGMGYETIETGAGPNQGFRNHPTTTWWLNELQDAAKTSVESLIRNGELPLDCGESETRSILEMVGADKQYLFYVDGGMPDVAKWPLRGHDNTLAGGIGHYGSPPFYSNTPDWRNVNKGNVVITRDNAGNYSVKLEQVELQVHDAFDLWPGNLGAGGAVKYATTILLFLEINGRADDVVFDAIWTHPETEPIVLGVKAEQKCDLCDSPNPPDDCKDIERPASSDPNDIIGPAGYGPENHIVANNIMPFMIRFENDPEEATAPAATVTITQTLDSGLDWTTFRFGNIGFGNTIVSVPGDTAFFQTRYDATSTLGVVVDITASIDILTGVIQWELATVDPMTGDLPENPFVGFLPPNNDNGDGEGFVSYTVRPKAGVTTGVRVDATASIVFDVNDAIVTPAIFNTFDVGRPTSSVSALATTVSTTNFPVSWTGTDDNGGSGITSYDVYVSINGGAYALWLNDTSETSNIYRGIDGNSYAFYSVAIDNVGNREDAPNVADTSTTIDAGLGTISGITWLDINGNGLREDGEQLLPDQIVYLDLNDSGQRDSDEPNVATNENGVFTFDDLLATQYFVRLIVPDDWEQTYPVQLIELPGSSGIPGTGSVARLDVNADRRISALDALLIINRLNLSTGTSQRQTNGADPLDVNADSRVSALDALVVINALNNGSLGSYSPNASGEGDEPGYHVTLMADATIDGAIFGIRPIEVVPPHLDQVVVGNGTMQRSMIRSLEILFNSMVTFDDGAFTLETDDETIPVTVETHLVDGRTRAILTFGQSIYVEPSGSLADGNYRLTTDYTLIRDILGNPMVDEDDEGSPSSRVDEFFRLFGDVDADREVDLADYAFFLRTLDKTAGQAYFDEAFDYNADELVDLNDLQFFNRNLGKVLQP